MKNDTLTSFIRAECANLIKADQCLGLDVFGKRFMNQDKCLILRKKRCEYFKKCVLPISLDLGCYDNIIGDYLKIDRSVSQDIELRRCECGTEIPKGRQICDKCKKTRRMETYREQNLKRAG